MKRHKIFVTALPRTGTSSLEYALRQIGYRTIHFPYQLYDEINHPVLSENDAFTDLPIPLRYRLLDEACPGAKFIHVWREENAWLNSMAWLFEHGRREFQWDKWGGLIDRMHIEMYGAACFDRELFRDRYRRYEADIDDYFSGREGDFLKLELTSPDGFERLCHFLGEGVIKGPLPRRNDRVGIIRSTIRRQYRSLRQLFGGY